jgi:hypothetical protein
MMVDAAETGFIFRDGAAAPTIANHWTAMVTSLLGLSR